MRIVILCEFGSVNGGERSLLAALEHLRSAIEPVFLAPPRSRLAESLRAGGWRHEPFDVRDGDARRRSTADLLWELADRVESVRPRLVHGNSLSMGRLTGRLASSIGVPCTAHLRDIIKLNRAAVNDLNGNHRLFAVSEATRDFHVNGGLDAARTRVVYNGVDLQTFRPAAGDAERVALRRELRLPTDATLAATIGQIGLRKGLDVLAAAVTSLASGVPNLHLLLIGERYSGKAESVEFEMRLRQDLARDGLERRVHWLRYRDDVPTILRGVDLLIHPARQEPFGRVLLEAAASGLAIVATRVGGTAEMLTDGRSALFVPSDDPPRLAFAIERAVNDASLRQALGRAAREAMERRFDITQRALDLGRAWNEVAAAR
jgi:glycosyltransferase involved in cell wall biosynthesis